MTISLIICTYMRPKSVIKLLESISYQTRIPDEIIIVDSSTNNETTLILDKYVSNLNIKYFFVNEELRGLTKQRNFGISKVSKNMELISFLDDDIVLDKDYFLELFKAFQTHSDAIGVGGVTTNEVKWVNMDKSSDVSSFCYDGWSRKEDKRYIIRKKLSLVSDMQPAINTGYGNERSVGFLPPSGKTYKVDFFMGGIASYKKEIFNKVSFSEFFEGYGLYEDKDFTLKCSKIGSLYVNTKAKCEHHHDPLGRPNFYKYGKMVVWNGWRVWRISNSNPTIMQKIKWWLTTILLTYLRLVHIITSNKKKDAFFDFFGRNVSMIKLMYSKPRMD